MLAIYQRVLDALNRIDHKCIHDVTTHVSRKLASLHMRNDLNVNNDLKESSVLIYIFEQTKKLKSTGYFGLWGYKGSFFVQEMSRVLAETVRGLGLMAAESMEISRKYQKNTLKKSAFEVFVGVLRDENASDPDIIRVAENQQVILNSQTIGRFLLQAKNLQPAPSEINKTTGVFI